MANEVVIAIEGDSARKLNAALSRLEQNMQKKVVRKALRRAGKDLLSATQALAPVDTGRLRRGLKLRALPRSRTRIGVRVMTGSREEMGIGATSKWYYPAIVEFMPGHSYMRRARDTREGAVKSIVKNEILGGVARAVRESKAPNA